MEGSFRKLSLGIQGKDVRLLQNRLKKLGFDIPDYEINKGIFGSKTDNAVKKFQERNNLKQTGIVDKKLSTKIFRSAPRERKDEQPTKPSVSEEFILQGRVVDADAQPFAHGLVRAFDKSLRAEKKLGSDTFTDADGRYMIRYIAYKNKNKDNNRSGDVDKKSEINIRIAAYDKYSKELASSPIRYSASSYETMDDLVIPRDAFHGPSEYERLVSQLNPLLEGSSLSSLAELTQDEKHHDITFLAGKTGLPPEYIAYVSWAHRLQKETEIEAEIYYGFFCQGLPTQLPRLLAQSPEVQRRALESAVKQNIIPFRFGGLLDGVLKRLTKLMIRRALEMPQGQGQSTTTTTPTGQPRDDNNNNNKTSLGQLLSTVLPDRGKQEAFLSAYIKHSGPIGEFWKALKSKPGFGDHVENLQLTFQLAMLTKNHRPLIKEIQRMRRSGEIASLSDLARFDKEDWLKIISSRPRHGGGGQDDRSSKAKTAAPAAAVIGFPSDTPGKDDDEKAANYAHLMARMVEDISPTAFIARRVGRAKEDDDDDYFADMPGKKDLLTFLNANPEFDFKYGRLESYLAGKPKALEKVSDVEGTKSRIKTMQRLYKVAGRCDHMGALMKDGLGSAHAIARMGENAFMAEYGDALGGSAAAKAIHKRAMDVQAKAITLLAEHGIASYKVSISALPDEVQREVKEIPEWSTLFGSLDLCQCEHCKSVYSPAAYLVDVLHFLNDRRSKIRKGKKRFNTIKEVLFDRRADIGDIALTCENVNTPLPYVDLVNETLENAVWRFRSFSPFTLPAKLEADLNRQPVSKTLRDAFSPPLSSEASISICGQGEPWALDEPCWSIDDLPFTYTVRKEKKTDNKLHVVSRSLQTKGSASERGASPQYINTRSYDVLRHTVFPWTLPFHFWDEEVRTYLGHLGVMRHQIMETFLSGDRKVILNSPALTQEHLGISIEEANIITGITKSQPDNDELPFGDWIPGIWNLWGFGAKTLSFQHSIPDASDSTRRITSGDWFETITERVDVFLQQSGLKYHELLDLLDTVFVNPLIDAGRGSSGGGNGGRKLRAIQISSKDANDPFTCEIHNLQLAGLNKRSTALKIMRFVRLWQKMAAAVGGSWTMRDLDRTINALGAEELNDTFISKLSHIQRLRSRLNLPVISLLTFWAPIDTASYYVDHSAPGRPKVPSLYARLFRNKTVSETLDPAFPEDPKELEEARRTLSHNAQAISNSLGISTAEFQLLLESPNVIPISTTPGGTKPRDKLDLEHLSLLYRHSVLAKALKIPIRDYISLLELFATTTQQPFGSTADTVLFVENVDRIRASPFSIPELDYLLLPPSRGKTSPSPSPSSSSSIAPTEEAIAAVLDEIRAGLQRIISENTFNEEGAESDNNVNQTTDLNSALIRQKLALLNWDSALVGNVLLTLNGAVKYQAQLAALPSGLKLEMLNDTGMYEVHLESLPDDDFSFPPEVANSIRHDKTAKKIIASRFFSLVERALLRNASSNADYQKAIEELFKLQDDPGLQGKISYDKVSQVLEFTGIMTRARLNRLKDAVADTLANRPYREAIDSLFDAPRKFVSRYMHTFSVQNFSKELAALPSTVQFPKSLKDKVYFDSAEKPNRLHFIGVMTDDERNLLLELSTDSDYQSAVNELFDKAEIYEVHLESLPDDDFSFPPEVANSIRHDKTAKKIIASRFFSLVERALLRNASSNADYQKAIEELFKLQGGWVLDNTKTSEERFQQVLKRLLPHLRQTLSEGLVKQKIAESFNLEYKVADELLTRYMNAIINSRVHKQNKSITAFVPTPPDFLAKSFAEGNPNVKLTRDTFPDQFDTFTLLHKIATIITKFQISSRQLFWIFEEYGPNPSVGWLDLNKLPIITEDKLAPFDKWLKLLELFRLCDVLPSGERMLDEIFKLTRTRKNSPPEIEKIPCKISKVLIKYTRWDLTDLNYLVGDKVFNFTVADFQDESALARLWDCFSLINGLKMSAKQCRELAEVDDIDDVSLPKDEREKRRKKREARSRSLRQTIRARYDGRGGGNGDNSEDQWLTVAKPLRDLLREKQRAALVDYLVAHLKIRFPVLERPHPILSRKKETIKKHKLAVKELQQKLNAAGAKPAPRVNGIFGKKTHDAVVDFQQTNSIVVPGKGVVGPETWSVLDRVRWSPRDKNDLYAHYLIDVEMSPCMMTSRIKQAISSVQLFVQRCFMNLEEGVEASVAVDDRWAEWDWMKNYRVWEANRKIFLYPENWIEPELRDDKSPFFKELESQLLQDELTDEVAEAALMSYLTKLDQVARLEIIGTYHQVERETNILHVFGRTLGTPHVYYYRQLVNSTHWSPWERLDVDVEGNHLAPVVWNRRLYLFWITFTLKTRSKFFDEPGKPPEDEKYYELKIAWSERQENKWSAKKVSSNSMDFHYFDPSLVAPFPADVGLSCRIDNRNNLNVVIFAITNRRSQRYGGRLFRFNGCNSDPEVVDDVTGLANAPQNTFFNYNFLEEIEDRPFYLPASSEVETTYVEVLSSTPGNFRLLTPHDITWLYNHPSFYMDKTRSFFISPGDKVSRERYWWQTDGIDPVSVFGKLIRSRYNDLEQLQARTIARIRAAPQDPLKVNASFPITTDRNNKRSTNVLSPDVNITALTTVAITETREAKEGARSVSVLSANRFTEGDNGSSPVSKVPFVMEATSLTLSDSAGLVIPSHPNGGNNSVGGHIPAFPAFIQGDIKYRFKTFYHPYVCSFIRVLNSRGIEGLYKRNIQIKPVDPIPILEWPHPILKLQDPWIEGPAVKELETKLNAWGVEPQLNVDGRFGQNTRDAVKSFQRANGITPTKDGLVGEKTWSLLDTVPPAPFDFSKEHLPTSLVEDTYPVEDVDFKYSNAYSLYNWELFFHVPLLIADRLGKNQRFAEAQKWFHRIFDPTGISNSDDDDTSDPIPQRYWVTKPFYETTREDYQKQRIQVLLKLLAVGNVPEKWEKLSDEEKELLEELRNSIDEWRKNPFKPHFIARMRSIAYQKTVVMKYIDNLTAWGDQLFRRETIESINEATQLYILAAEILGRRPEEAPARAGVQVQTYNGLEPRLDEFSNALIQIEELVTPSEEGGESSDPGGQAAVVTLPTMLYFCVPKNDKLIEYWDTVADRLFKIRHCMNIQGIVRQLPLFEPPIDPALLVKAAAAGIDISSVLNDINAALPHYRFNLLAQKASELCSELKSLGAALLATLEKKDAEELALIRVEHEMSLLKSIELVKEKQLEEAVENQSALRKSRDVALGRYMHYQKLLGVQNLAIPTEGQNIQEFPASEQANTLEENSVKIIPFEKEELDRMISADDYQEDASWFEKWANIAHMIPTFTTTAGILFVEGSVSFGGPNIGAALQAWASWERANAASETFNATMASKMGQYIMRAHEWKLQSDLAAREIMQIDKQIAAAGIRIEIARQELSNHVKQIQNAGQVEDFMRSKYTNQELYSWMIGQISAIYFQSYQLVYDVAKRAETAYRFELGLDDSSFIQFGYWDSLKRGLLAGERLFHDIKRMEVAYLDQNRREYEITKHVSLLRLDPLALAQLKQTGECFVLVPEALFDLDFPGHYLRRIKYVSLTVPCVTGPYVGVNCTLTLLKSSIRHSNSLLGSEKRYSRMIEEDDPRFRDNNGAIQSIVTSSGQNDSGLFETNLKDERYLPFEGSGAISEWHIQLPKDFRQFDYDTISDVVLHLRYTAREGGESLKNQAVTELQNALNEFLRTEGQKGLALPVSLRHEFPSEWHRFLNPLRAEEEDSEGKNTLTLNLGAERFPFMFQGRPINVNNIELFVKVRPEFAPTHNESTLNLSLKPGTDTSDDLHISPWNGLLRAVRSSGGELGNWTLTGWLKLTDNTEKRIDPNAIEDMLVICHYSL